MVKWLSSAAVAVFLAAACNASTAVQKSAAVSPTPIGKLSAGVAPQVPSTGDASSSSNLTLVEADPLDASAGWALLCTLPPSGGQCESWVSSTSDGGSTWSTPTKVGPQPVPTGGDSGHHIHFVDRSNGFVYGSANTAFVTHDGGRTWAGTDLHFLEVVAVVGQSPWTWAITYPCGKGTSPTCPFEIYLSRDGGRIWAESWALPGNLEPQQAVAFGEGGLLVSGRGSGDMFMTADSGSHWTTLAGRCSADTYANYVATSDGTELWHACGGAFPDLAPRTLFVSEDGGATWAQRSMVASPGPSTLGIPTPAVLVSRERGTALLAMDQSPMMVSRDSGKSWAPTTKAQGFKSVAYASAAIVWAVYTNGAIWISTDGGSGWSPLPSQPTSASPSPVTSPSPNPTPPSGCTTTHTVRPGESLWGIANSLGLNWHDLYRLNLAEIGPNPRVIHIGIVLQLGACV